MNDNLKKIISIAALLVAIIAVTSMLETTFLSADNIQNIVRWTSLYAIISIGVAFVIITGGIDLSIGSVIGLVGCVLPILVTAQAPWSDSDAVVDIHAATARVQVDGATRFKVGQKVALMNQGGESAQILTIAAIEPLSSGQALKMAGSPQALAILESGEKSFSQEQDSARDFGDRAVFPGIYRSIKSAMGFNDGGPGWRLVLPHSLVSSAPAIAATPENSGQSAPGTLAIAAGSLSSPPSLRDRVALITQTAPDGPATVSRFTVVSSAASDANLQIRVEESPGIAPGAGATAYLAPISRKVMAVPTGIFITMLMALSIGLLHGTLITRLKLQPFVVTLCGLLFYRGLARFITGDATQGFGTGFTELKYFATGRPFELPLPGLGNIQIPMPFLTMIFLAILAGMLLNRSIYGRYLLALGRNEQAAKYSGINTNRMTLMAYVICSGMAGVAGILFALDLNSIQPSTHGSFYELYAIAAAVLGGCSLRGGEGTILGVVIGAAVMRVLYNAINMLGIPTQLEFAVIGLVILAGVIADELFKRMAARRRAAREAAAGSS